MLPPCIALSLRPKVGRFLHCKVCADTLGVDDLSIANYQKVKERLASAPLPQCIFERCAIPPGPLPVLRACMPLIWDERCDTKASLSVCLGFCVQLHDEQHAMTLLPRLCSGWSRLQPIHSFEFLHGRSN